MLDTGLQNTGELSEFSGPAREQPRCTWQLTWHQACFVMPLLDLHGILRPSSSPGLGIPGELVVADAAAKTETLPV